VKIDFSIQDKKNNQIKIQIFFCNHPKNEKESKEV
jgi:hypothetical protein